MDLKQAIKEFPIHRWLEDVARVKKHGETKIRCDCPHCGKKNALAIYLDSRYCKCYACSEGGFGGARWRGYGGLPDLISLFENKSQSEAIATIFEYVGVADYSTDRVLVSKQFQAALPEGSLPLAEVYDEHTAVVSLANRGLLKIRDKLFIVLEGRYNGRWIIPVYEDGKLVGFEAKAFRQLMYPKSLFPAWMTTSNMLYQTAWDWSQDFAVITESSFDAETLGCNTFGIFGAALGAGQFAKLLQYRKLRGLKRLVWFLDGDAWKKQRKAILKKTALLFQNYVVSVSGEEDPNSLGHDECWKRVSEATFVNNILDLYQREKLCVF